MKILVFIIFPSLALTTTTTTTGLVNVSVSDSWYFQENNEVHIRKCCPFNYYYNSAMRQCNAYTTVTAGVISNYGISESETPWLFVNSTSSAWEATRNFVEHYQPILVFDSTNTGMPNCASGNDEMIRTVVTEIANLTEWKRNWDTETNYYFTPYSPVLVEVAPGPPYKETRHNPGHFCVDLTPTHLVMRICACTDKQPCLRKCCPPDEHLVRDSDGSLKCSGDFAYMGNATSINTTDLHDAQIDRENNPRDLQLLSNLGVHLSDDQLRNFEPRYQVGLLHCEHNVISSGWSESILKSSHYPFWLRPNGQPNLFDPRKNAWEVQSGFSDFCFDSLELDLNVNQTHQEVCPGEREVLLVCTEEFEGDVVQSLGKDLYTTGQSDASGFYMFYTIGLVIATILLLLTAIVVSLLLEQRNVHSWTRLAYVLNHFCFFLFNVIVTESAVKAHSHPVTCQALGVLTHFFGLTASCWLSVLNFDLWWTFRILKPTGRDKLDQIRFIWYSCFAFGIPIVIIFTALGIQSHKKEYICRAQTHLPRPVYPDYVISGSSCFLSDEARPVYWFTPVVILLVANLLFFVTTTYKMVRFQRITRKASITSTTGREKSQSGLFIKLFIVSGVTWWVEIIQWWFNTDKENSGHWLWLLLEMVHFLHAISLFIILVCKRDVIRSLQIKFPIVKKIIPPVGNVQWFDNLNSVSTDATPKSLRVRMMSRLSSRKMSTVSASLPLGSETTTTTTVGGTGSGPIPIPLEESELQEHCDAPQLVEGHEESFELWSSPVLSDECNRM